MLHKLNKLIDDDEIIIPDEGGHLVWCMQTNDGLNNYLVSYFAKKKGSKVLITGIGMEKKIVVDIPSFKRIPIMTQFSKYFPKNKDLKNSLHKILYKLLKMLNTNTKYADVLKYGNNTFDAFKLQRCVFNPEEVMDLINKNTVEETLYDLEFYKDNETNNNDFDNEQLKIMYYEIKYYLCSKLLRDADWTTMSNSTELRTPFVDWFFFKELLPILKSNIKISKLNMLDSFKELVPNELYSRKKTGFAIPIDEYYKLSHNLGIVQKEMNKLVNLSYKKYIQYS